MFLGSYLLEDLIRSNSHLFSIPYFMFKMEEVAASVNNKLNELVNFSIDFASHRMVFGTVCLLYFI